ncbi:hypothetical protein ACQ3X0_004280 [Escherichia coli]
MASINTIVKRKQYLWLGIVVVGAASAIGGALYLSDVDMSGNGEAVAEQEPVPDMTGVVDTTFDDKVRQHATTEMQMTAAQMQKQYEEIRRELDVLNKQRGDDQRRIEKLGQDNAALAEQVKALGANPVTATGEPVLHQTCRTVSPGDTDWCGQRSDRGVPGRLPAENCRRDGAGAHAEQSRRRQSGKSGSCSAIS